MHSEKDMQMLRAHIMVIMLYMKKHGYGVYKEMSYKQIMEKANDAVNEKITVKEHLILIMCSAKQKGYGQFKDMSYEQIEKIASELRDCDQLSLWNNHRSDENNI